MHIVASPVSHGGDFESRGGTMITSSVIKKTSERSSSAGLSTDQVTCIRAADVLLLVQSLSACLQLGHNI